MTVLSLPPNELLGASYSALGLSAGRLLDTGGSQATVDREPAGWSGTQEWLTLAARMGAQKVFFVDDDPVLVFAALPQGAAASDWISAYRGAWCLARPQCVFLATPDELRVYPLSSPPVASEEDWHEIKPLEVVRKASEVGDRLAIFERARVESGDSFTDRRFASTSHRADRQLLSDVRNATSQLIASGLPPSSAHALVERVLLIRYLEDRGVVTPEYYSLVAANGDGSWETLLHNAPATPIINRTAIGLESVLTDKAFTLAVFHRLAADFNGDLFIVDREEEDALEETHLELVRRMLLGDTDEFQAQLFLWAYDFSIVPTSLISSMYEQFFHTATGHDSSGTHYTPPELVQYVVDQVLSDDLLDTAPRVLDPACGSGIFLVEAYRQIIRFESTRQQRPLTPAELRSLLITRIAGIDTNPEAVRLAAFSLYLALLHYQKPQDILQSGPLPPLISKDGMSAPLHVGDAFGFTESELDAHADEDSAPADLPWERASFDVVIGNPPWTEPPGGRHYQEDAWVARSGRAVADRSPSQAFIWRTLSLLRAEGVAGLLVSAGVIANARSRRFRAEFLQSTRLIRVVNFSAARSLFFSKASAPFLFVHFSAEAPLPENWFEYQSVLPTRALARTRSISFARMDRRIVRQGDVAARDYLWKTYAWGSHHDAQLMAFLGLETTLGDLLQRIGTKPGLGWQRGRKPLPDFLHGIPELDVSQMNTFGPLRDEWFGEGPSSVAFPTKAALYHGQRLIVSRRAYPPHGPRARLETAPFSYRHTAYGFPLQGIPEWQAMVVLGTLLSSLGRYNLFMRAGRWGPWYDEVTQGELLTTPLRFVDPDDSATRRVIRAVEMIQSDDAVGTAGGGGRDLTADLKDLDEAVYSLFGLSRAQRDLIEDFHAAQEDFAESSRDPSGGRVSLDVPIVGVLSVLPQNERPRGSLSNYLRPFLKAWNAELGSKAEVGWEVYRSNQPAILCVVFKTLHAGAPVSASDTRNEDALSRLESVVDRPVARGLFVDGVLRYVGEAQIMIAKRDERRLWSPSAAREDMEATMLRVMALQRA